MVDKEKEYIKNELEYLKRQKKGFHIQFSKIAVLLLIANIVFIEIVSIQMMRDFADLSALYVLLGIAGTECTAGVIWYMKNSAQEKKYQSEKEIQLLKIDQMLDRGDKINPLDLVEKEVSAKYSYESEEVEFSAPTPSMGTSGVMDEEGMG